MTDPKVCQIHGVTCIYINDKFKGLYKIILGMASAALILFGIAGFIADKIWADHLHLKEEQALSYKELRQGISDNSKLLERVITILEEREKHLPK